MFFHHPEAEARLRQMAHGPLIEASDLTLWPRVKTVLKFIGFEILIGFLILLLAGIRHDVFRDSAWCDFMLAGVVMVTARLKIGHLEWHLDNNPTTRVLWHLPVSGHDIGRWVRGTFFCRSLALLPRMTVVAYAWQGFPALSAAWPLVCMTGLLLWLVMLACVMLSRERLGFRLQAAHLWNLALMAWVAMLLYAWWLEKRHAGMIELPAWVSAFCGPASWLLPAKWAMHGTWHGISSVLTLLCLGMGGLRWWQFPSRVGVVLDQTTADFLPDEETLNEDETLDENDLSNSEGSLPAAEQFPPDKTGSVTDHIRLTAALEASPDHRGWVERLVFAFLDDRQRMLAPLLTDHTPGWTKKWQRGALLAALLLAVGTLLQKLGAALISMQTLEPWLWIIPLGVVGVYAFPISNSIPAATTLWPLASRGMLFFAGLPISVRDLLGLSTRIAIARMAAFLLLAAPVLTIQRLLLGGSVPASLLTLLAFATAWTSMRPLFIYYRLQESSRAVRTHLFGLFFCHFVILVLGVSMLPVMIAGVVSSAMILENQPWQSPLCLLITALAARSIFGLFHWRARVRKIDWVSQ
jgi:hypothetical protein